MVRTCKCLKGDQDGHRAQNVPGGRNDMAHPKLRTFPAKRLGNTSHRWLLKAMVWNQEPVEEPVRRPRGSEVVAYYNLRPYPK